MSAPKQRVQLEESTWLIRCLLPAVALVRASAGLAFAPVLAGVGSPLEFAERLLFAARSALLRGLDLTQRRPPAPAYRLDLVHEHMFGMALTKTRSDRLKIGYNRVMRSVVAV